MNKYHPYLGFLVGLALALSSAVVLKYQGVQLSQFYSPLPARAAAGSYSLDWSIVDSGGGKSSAGQVYQLQTSIGQPAAGRLSGGVFTLETGFWPGPSLPWRLFVPQMRR